MNGREWFTLLRTVEQLRKGSRQENLFPIVEAWRVNRIRVQHWVVALPSSFSKTMTFDLLRCQHYILTLYY